MEKREALIICVVGFTTSMLLFMLLLSVYYYDYDEKLEEDEYELSKLDIIGTISIIAMSMLYWIFFAKLRCINYELVSMWPRMAFRYGLGSGIVAPIITYLLTKGNMHESSKILKFAPLMVLSMIFGSYIFSFIEVLTMNSCGINLESHTI